jgi:sulfate adenylyltransferase
MNSPMGGTLIDRECPADKKNARRSYAAELRRLPADRNLILDLEKIADGTFSPLRGFMGQKDVRSVLDDMQLADGQPWTIPVVFHATHAQTEGMKPGDAVAVWNVEEEEIAAILTVAEIFAYDKDDFCMKVFATTEDKHPGVGQVLRWGDRLVAGEIELLSWSKPVIPERFERSPRHVRAEIERRGWKRVVGFQTRNLGHRAHEHLQKIALEQVDGLLIHPLVGWKKRGDMLPEVILEGYELLIASYYVQKNVMLSGLTTAMRYAGPREAVFHSIIRKNFGCTHFIVGRDHAGVGGYYDKYAAHRIFDRLKGDLGITIMRLHGPCYCKKCMTCVTEHTCPHTTEWHDISGTEVRAMIAAGERPPATFMRPEIADFLVERAKTGQVFF